MFGIPIAEELPLSDSSSEMTGAKKQRPKKSGPQGESFSSMDMSMSDRSPR